MQQTLLACPTLLSEVRQLQKQHGGDIIEVSPRSVCLRVKRGKYPVDIVRFSLNGSRLEIRPKEFRFDIKKYKKISDELSKIELPRSVPWTQDKGPIKPFPAGIPYWSFYNMQNELVMFQVRFVLKNGERKYLFYTYWEDGKWRQAEPTHKLPLYVPNGIEELQSARIAYVHEGAKAAQAMQDVVNNDRRHPLKRQMKDGIHLGFVGGANFADKTDWTMLKHLEEVVIIADNDLDGRRAIPVISKNLNIPTYALFFDDSFPVGFDLADDWPKGLKRSFYDMVRPATWLDDKRLVAGTKRFTYPIRENCHRVWSYIEEINALVPPRIPDIRIQIGRSKHSSYLAPYCFGKDSPQNIPRFSPRALDGLQYRPGHSERVIRNRLNVWNPSSVEPNSGSCDLWLEFLDYMIPDNIERFEFMRWIATLIARPKTRIGYGLLLITRSQGIGKTTLGEKILAPILGDTNVSFPRGSDFDSEFNGWCVNKQLAFVNEIYEGKGWSVYHKLKTTITDNFVTVNEKYVPQYTMHNWCHIVACSNSERALKIEKSDRRWFIPRLSETPWTKKKYRKLNLWLEGSGLGAILQWSLDFGKENEYINAGDHAPQTAHKLQIILDSQSDAAREIVRIGTLFTHYQKPLAITEYEIYEYLKACFGNRMYEGLQEVGFIFSEIKGLTRTQERTFINGTDQHIWMNSPAVKTETKIDQDSPFIGSVLTLIDSDSM